MTEELVWNGIIVVVFVISSVGFGIGLAYVARYFGERL